MKQHTFMDSLNAPGKKSLVFNIVASLVFVFAINGLIFALGWNDSSSISDSELTPPGYIVGLIWVVLFALLGYTRWRVRDNQTQRRLVTALIIACALYPFYTAGLDILMVGLIGNVLTLLFAYFVLYKLAVLKRELLLVPLLVWLTFAAYITAINMPS